MRGLSLKFRLEVHAAFPHTGRTHQIRAHALGIGCVQGVLVMIIANDADDLAIAHG
jgi:hypothetical protein